MNQSETLGNLAMALSAVQGELRPAEENARNPFFKSQYADLGSIIKAARRLMAIHGLSVSQFPGPTYCDQVSGNAYATLTTILMHESGEWLSQDLTMPLAKVDPQGYGSAITYARRYALASVLGIVAGEDDDGNGAADKQPAKVVTKTKPVQAKVVTPTMDEVSGDSEPEPKYNEPLFNGKTADARAWLEEKVVDDKVVFGFVADAAVMQGGYGSREHVRNALKGTADFVDSDNRVIEGKPGYDFPANFDLHFGKNVTGTGGLKVYDWLMSRKVDEFAKVTGLGEDG